MTYHNPSSDPEIGRLSSMLDTMEEEGGERAAMAQEFRRRINLYLKKHGVEERV